MIIAEILRTLAALTQTTRLIQLSTALPDAALVVSSFTNEDHVSSLRTVEIDCITNTTLNTTGTVRLFSLSRSAHALASY